MSKKISLKTQIRNLINSGEKIFLKEYAGRKASGVTAFKIFDEGILIKFNDDKRLYLYDYEKPGLEDVEKMKAIALQGKKLSTHISQQVKLNYSDKFVIN